MNDHTPAAASTAALTWERISEAVSSCTRCPLCQGRRNTVFGVGSREAEILFVGEGPGEQEDRQGEPFVGRAGQLLDLMLAAVGLSRRRNVYIANIVKCRPPGNRDPLPEEQEACIGYLRGQTSLLRPKIIVCLGRIAACRLIDPEFRITRQHGQIFERKGILMTATFHPAALLRNPGQKGDAFADFLMIRDRIGEVCERTELVYE
ncbi:MAG: uracil-DNA glycosylase [Oscillospiraceae bacterium]|nr:uracil-DNA glycosylase [Oscillospiraceae bacterium]